MKNQERSPSGLPGRPDAVLPGAAQRQREIFGRSAIDPFLVSLRDRLAAALTAGPQEARGVAHQLAGFAGMLGFAELAEAWEAYSAEGESRRSDARRLAQCAVATLRQVDLSDSEAWTLV